MAKKQGSGEGPVIIKKYANRRLYNTALSSYITLDDLAAMTRENVDFQVLDAKTGNDITHSILTQIIMEEESSGEQMLPVSFLRQLISMYGNSMQAMMPQYLEAAMQNFFSNQQKFQQAFKDGVAGSPFEKIAETNRAMFRAATAFVPGVAQAADGGTAPQAGGAELDALRREMAEMRKKLDALGK